MHCSLPLLSNSQSGHCFSSLLQSWGFLCPHVWLVPGPQPAEAMREHVAASGHWHPLWTYLQST